VGTEHTLANDDFHRGELKLTFTHSVFTYQVFTNFRILQRHFWILIIFKLQFIMLIISLQNEPAHKLQKLDFLQNSWFNRKRCANFKLVFWKRKACVKKSNLYTLIWSMMLSFSYQKIIFYLPDYFLNGFCHYFSLFLCYLYFTIYTVAKIT